MKILFLLNFVRLVGSLVRVSKIAVEQEIIPICNQMATWVAVGKIHNCWLTFRRHPSHMIVINTLLELRYLGLTWKATREVD